VRWRIGFDGTLVLSANLSEKPVEFRLCLTAACGLKATADWPSTMVGSLVRGDAAMMPRATYRLQFHSGFRFEDAARLAPYLADSG